MSKQQQQKMFANNMFFPCSELGILHVRTSNSMDNLLSYCGLVDAKIRASDIDLPVLLYIP
jgi:hypothetical protein